MNQLMDGKQWVLNGVVLQPVHHHGGTWNILLLDTQQPHSRRIIWKARQGKQLFNTLYIHCGYTKGPLVPFWVLEVSSSEVVYTKDAQSVWAGQQ